MAFLGSVVFTGFEVINGCNDYKKCAINMSMYGAGIFSLSLFGCWQIKRGPVVSAAASTGVCAAIYIAYNLPIENQFTKMAAGMGVLVAYIACSACYLRSEMGGGRGVWSYCDCYDDVD